MGKGANYLNNNKGVYLQSSKKQTSDKMVECQYGAGCIRKNCIYSHPTRNINNNFQQSQEPCMAYLAGICSFTANGCKKRHPPNDEVEKLIAKYQTMKCRFGDSCKTNGCLYLHPSDVEEYTDAGVEEGGNGGSGMTGNQDQGSGSAMNTYNNNGGGNDTDTSYMYEYGYQQPYQHQYHQQQQETYHDPSAMYYYQQQLHGYVQEQEQEDYNQSQYEQTTTTDYTDSGVDAGMNPNAVEWKPSFTYNNK